MPALAKPRTTYRSLSDAQLEAELAAIERRLERLADATWPAAPMQRAQLEELADRLRAEQQRRLTP